MPRNPAAARRYANALLQSIKADSKNGEALQQALQELKGFQSVLKQVKDADAFFVSPAIRTSEKIGALNELREKIPAIDRFLVALVEANRMETFDEVVEEFERALEERSGEMSVELEVAHPIPDSMVEEIRCLLTEKWQRNLKMKTKVNPKLIGGFVARAPGKLLDASVASQLEALEQQVVAG